MPQWLLETVLGLIFGDGPVDLQILTSKILAQHHSQRMSSKALLVFQQYRALFRINSHVDSWNSEAVGGITQFTVLQFSMYVRFFSDTIASFFCDKANLLVWLPPP